ncbi:sensor histidine kinase [Actinoallomurus spadix]|uniref:histidine kinase n=2 Tax=Actinoallomurus spadix TaxID=79912 RepID=A0ABN0XPF1_9ACTN
MSVFLAAAFLAAALLQGDDGAPNGPDVFSVVLGGAALMSLTVRRRLPVGVLAFVTAVCGTLTVMGYDVSAPAVAMLIATYTVAAHRGLATSLPVGALTLMLFIALLFVAGADFWPAVSNTILFVGVWWLGRSLRLRRAYLNELEARARRLERAREADARAARTEERSRIARELHDVVAHHVSVMTVQAGAARRILERDPDAVRDALSTIEQMGRTALGEMRRLVGVLRTEAEPVRGELSPQPGVNDVGELVDHLRETGLQVQLWIEGDSRSLSPGVDLAAFRLIQEALTNTLKHAGPQARAWVRIHYTDRQLMVEVEDDGRGLAAGLGQNGSRGHGLVGMRERVALYGGDLRIGPRSGGGFEVRARFPLEV